LEILGDLIKEKLVLFLAIEIDLDEEKLIEKIK